MNTDRQSIPAVHFIPYELLETSKGKPELKVLGDVYLAQVWKFICEWNRNTSSFSLQTSGSTGEPKTISVSRLSMQQSARLTGEFLELRQGQTALLCLPVGFIAGKMMIVRAITLGLNLLVVEPSKNPLLRVDDGITIDFAAFTPMQLTEIFSNDDSLQKLMQIRSIIIGGASVSSTLERQVQWLPYPVFETFGMTETLTHIAMRRLNGPVASELFESLPGITLRSDERGCLVIHAPHLDEPAVVTNDLVELHSHRTFRWLGRVDNVINSGGLKIYPEKIERKIATLLSKRFIITNLPDPKLGELVALIIEGEAEDTAAIENRISGSLDTYEKPRKILFLPEFPKTLSGKVIRSAVAELVKPRLSI